MADNTALESGGHKRGPSARIQKNSFAAMGPFLHCLTTPRIKGIYMLNYERHLLVVTVICLVVIAVAIVAIVMGVPLPFVGKD